jgi:hypothetical protein
VNAVSEKGTNDNLYEKIIENCSILESPEQEKFLYQWPSYMNSLVEKFGHPRKSNLTISQRKILSACK